jgi:hypothetical protein
MWSLKGAVWADGFAADFLFLLPDERPAVRLAGGGEQGVERVAEAHFEEDVLPREVVQVGVILIDQPEQRLILLSRLDLLCHWAAFGRAGNGCNILPQFQHFKRTGGFHPRLHDVAPSGAMAANGRGFGHARWRARGVAEVGVVASISPVLALVSGVECPAVDGGIVGEVE